MERLQGQAREDASPARFILCEQFLQRSVEDSSCAPKRGCVDEHFGYQKREQKRLSKLNSITYDSDWNIDFQMVGFNSVQSRAQGRKTNNIRKQLLALEMVQSTPFPTDGAVKAKNSMA